MSDTITNANKWTIVDRWDIDSDGAEDMIVRNAETGRELLLVRRHVRGAADPATWCMAYGVTGVADVRAAISGREHVEELAYILDPIDWVPAIVHKIATAAANA